MDHSEKLTILSFCTGYGGLDMGIRRVLGERLHGIATSEIEAFAVANLCRKMEEGVMDSMPTWTNLKTFPNKQFYGLVDILVAGFPCQPFSAPGQKRATEDPRHLFPYIDRSIDEIKPRVVFLENVEGILNCECKNQPGAEDGEPVLLYVLRQLERRGYEATWGLFSAREVGAPHRRIRVFILGRRIEENIDWEVFCPGMANSESKQSGEQKTWNWREDTGGGSPEGREPEALADASSVQSFGQQSSGDFSVGHSSKEGRESEEGMADASSPRCDGREGCEEHVQRQSLQAPRSSGCDKMEGLHARTKDFEESEDSIARLFRGLGLRSNRRFLWPARPGEFQHFWEPPRNIPKQAGSASLKGVSIERRLGRTLDGCPSWLVRSLCEEASNNRVDRLRLIGNAVVPAVAENAWRTLWAKLLNKEKPEETLFGDILEG